MRLSELTTLRVGGEARRMLAPQEHDELIGQTLDAWASGEPWLVLGGGSNVLVSDDGFDGTVIRVLTRGMERVGGSLREPQGTKGEPQGAEADSLREPQGTDAASLREPEGPEAEGTLLRVQAGEPWDAVVEFAVANNLAGIEALSGIPGSAGAAPMQNIGAYGQELSDSLQAIEFLDFNSGELVRLSAAELELGYRTSTLKRGRSGLVVTIDLLLEHSELSRPVAYPQLASALGVSVGDRVPLTALRDAVLALRASKGMVLSADDPDSVSAGSFFTNPIVTENFARSLPTDAPRWLLDPDAPETHVKLSAAWLIERSGIRRGFSLPGSRAAISSKHTLALTNRGGATAEEIAELARYVHLRVLSQFGLSLQPEPVFVGLEL